MMDRKKLERKQRQQEIIRQQRMEESTPFDKSEIFQNFYEYVEKHAPKMIFAHCRVSGGAQFRNGGLHRQMDGVKKLLRQKGITGVRVRGECGPGWFFTEKERPELAKTFRMAGKVNAPVTFVCPSRAARGTDYHSEFNPDDEPTREQWEAITTIARKFGVPALLTLSDPNQSPAKDVGSLSMVSRLASGTEKVGRPKKKQPGTSKQRRLEWIEPIIKMKNDGMSIRAVAAEITRSTGHHVHPSTVML